MKVANRHFANVLTACNRGLKSVLDILKVLSAMALVFLILSITGPLTYAVQHIEYTL